MSTHACEHYLLTIVPWPLVHIYAKKTWIRQRMLSERSTMKVAPTTAGFHVTIYLKQATYWGIWKVTLHTTFASNFFLILVMIQLRSASARLFTAGCQCLYSRPLSLYTSLTNQKNYRTGIVAACGSDFRHGARSVPSLAPVLNSRFPFTYTCSFNSNNIL